MHGREQLTMSSAILTWIRKVGDFLFGFDFFISYAHSDGRQYPQKLADLLKSKGFRVFLDSRVYVAVSGWANTWSSLGDPRRGTSTNPRVSTADKAIGFARFSADGARIVAVDASNSIFIWDTATGEVLGSIENRSLDGTSVRQVDAQADWTSARYRCRWHPGGTNMYTWNNQWKPS
jgi:hypothetical protein